MTSRRAALAGLAVIPLARPGLAQAEIPIVAAASDLAFALAEIVQRFESAGHGRVRIVLGSSGNLARQIEQGAPFQLFLSADEGLVLRLAERGLARDQGALYGIGRIVLFVPPWSDLAPDGTLADLRAAVAAGRVRRFAIANPEHAPYGVAAMQALQHQRLWDAIRPALVVGDSASQAAQFATTGNSQGGIVAYALALAPQMQALGRFALIPQEWHAPLRQRMALLRPAGQVAARFHDFMMEAPARAIMARYGFLLPGE